MKRVLEPELMLDEVQVKAYAEADFSEPHNRFIELIREGINDDFLTSPVLDLGCGPGDVTCRFARAFPYCLIDAIDGSNSMIKYAKDYLPEDLKNIIRFRLVKIPDENLTLNRYETIISNSLLHHLPDPMVFWTTIKHCAGQGARIFVMDLLRPDDQSSAERMVARYAVDEPKILQYDFYHSLLAAFTQQEIESQLRQAEFPLTIRQISDRHVFIKIRK